MQFFLGKSKVIGGSKKFPIFKIFFETVDLIQFSLKKDDFWKTEIFHRLIIKKPQIISKKIYIYFGTDMSRCNLGLPICSDTAYMYLKDANMSATRSLSNTGHSHLLGKENCAIELKTYFREVFLTEIGNNDE